MAFLREKTGRWSPEKIAAFALAITPALWLAGRAITGDLGSQAPDQPAPLGTLGARPVHDALLFTGRWTVRFILLALAISPARRLFSMPKLINARRTLGVAAFCYGLVHFMLYVTDQMFDLGKVASEIVLRFYLTVGFVALIGLIALGSTSTDAAVRRLGSRWNTLHRAVYVIGILAIVHFALQKKLDIYEPTLMMGLLIWLLGYRVVHRLTRNVSFLWLLGIAAIATVGTAAFEAAWYGTLTGVRPSRVLYANLMVDIGLRPAWWVLIVTLAVAFASLAVQRLWPREPARAKLRPAE